MFTIAIVILKSFVYIFQTSVYPDFLTKLPRDYQKKNKIKINNIVNYKFGFYKL